MHPWACSCDAAACGSGVILFGEVEQSPDRVDERREEHDGSPVEGLLFERPGSNDEQAVRFLSLEETVETAPVLQVNKLGKRKSERLIR